MAAIEVDLKGLAKLIERKGVEWIALELVQNAWDTATGEVNIDLHAVPGKSEVILVVKDEDPDGFKDLSHAWTLFAESLKKDDPTQRGRFNMGEKLVLAYALAHGGEVTIKTTKGTVIFDKNGRRKKRSGTDVGSQITVRCRMTRAQKESTIQQLNTLIAPVPTFLNGSKLTQKEPIAFVDVSLPTEIADEEGVLRRRTRKTTVGVYEVSEGREAMVYEMGIPVVATGDKWHYDVLQKVPLNMERDNVPAGFLKTLRVAILNHMHEAIDKSDATSTWVAEATGDKRCNEDATETTLTHRFGSKRVAFDPKDPEANKIAMSKGFTVVHGGSLSKGQWSNARDVGTTLPAGRVTPSPKPYDPNGKPERVIDPVDYTAGMVRVVKWAQYVHEQTLGGALNVRIVKEPSAPWAANYGRGSLALNSSKLGSAWFSGERVEDQQSVNDLLIHEFAHYYSLDHFSHKFLDGATRLGASLASLMYHRGAENKGLWVE